MRIDPRSWETKGAVVPKETTDKIPSGDLQKGVNLILMDFARDADLPLLLTLDSHMVEPERKFIQDIMLQNGNPDGWRYTETYCMATAQMAWERWLSMGLGDRSREFASAAENNQVLVDMVEPISMPGRVRMPVVTVPERIRSRHPDSPVDQHLDLVLERIRLHGRFPYGNKVYEDRLHEEIEVIAYNGVVDFLPYFLFLDMEVCQVARDMGDLVGPGRGSAAGCLLSYLLRITHLDPIQHGLSFARFLSMGRINRGKFPDIDLDFGDAGAVAERLRVKHGQKVVRVSTVGTMKPRNALRDVSRVLLNTKEDPSMAELVDVVSKSISQIQQGISDSKKWMFGYTDDDGLYHQGEVDRNDLLHEFFQRFPEVRRGVQDALDVPKSQGRHASAYVVCDEPVRDVVPICLVNGEECTQFTKDAVEDMGLIKIDLLGLNTLKDIGGCIQWIERLRGEKIDFYDIPVQDRRTWAKFAAGENQTVFQFGSDIGIDLSRRVKPKSIEDLAQMTSAGRPGTMDALMPDGETKLIDQWIGVRQGNRDPEFVHPSVEHILAPTGGVCLYQEQISAMFQVACGYTEEQADEIREVVGKKKKDRMDQLLPEIRGRLRDSGWTTVQAESFISLCTAAANYSFNKSHAAAYSYTGYVCQYLKTNYPLEWWTSILQNSSKDDLEKNARYCCDLVSPPDVNVSELDFFIAERRKARSDEGRIVYPLRMVTNVKSAAQFIYDERPYADLQDFYSRVNRTKVNSRVVSQLIWAGAFDQMCGVESIVDRNRVFEQYLRLRKELDEETYRPRSELQLMKLQSAALPLWTPDYVEYMRGRPELSGVNLQGPGAVHRSRSGTALMVGGILKSVRRINTKKGDPMAFADLGNGMESTCLTFFPEAFGEFGEFLKEGEIVFVKGSVNEYRGEKSLVVDTFYVFDED